MTERGRQGGFRPFRVVAKVPESRIITSFHLEPVDPAGWLPFEAGQFLVVRIPEDGQRRAVPRSYSISSSPAERGRYRLSIKREAAPQPGIPDGIGSCWLHDRINVGDTITAAGPRGEFMLDRASSRPVALLSGGVGLTPMVSILHALAGEGRRAVDFIHACDSGDVHALREEVLATAAARPGMRVHFCYRFPTAADRSAGAFQSEGMLTADLLARLSPPDVDSDFYLCGPPPFMKAVYGILRNRGVPKERIAYEFFGPATVLEEDVKAAATSTGPSPASLTPASAAPARPTPAPAKPAARDWLHVPGKAQSADETSVTVEFRKSGRTVQWDPTAPSLLDFAEHQGLAPAFSCRSGVCGTCRTALLSGQVAYTDEPLDPPAPGEALICCSKPVGPVVLDL